MNSSKTVKLDHDSMGMTLLIDQTFVVAPYLVHEGLRRIGAAHGDGISTFDLAYGISHLRVWKQLKIRMKSQQLNSKAVCKKSAAQIWIFLGSIYLFACRSYFLLTVVWCRWGHKLHESQTIGWSWFQFFNNSCLTLPHKSNASP